MATYYPTSIPSSYISNQHQQQLESYHNSADSSFLELLSDNLQPRVENHDHRSLQYQELSLSLGVQGTVNGDSDQIPSGIVARMYDSRYLKPSQELLEEVVNLHECMRQVKMNRRNKVDRLDENDSSVQLLASEKEDLQNKITKLVSLTDEVDRKYREYCHQLRIVEAALDMVTGCGSARSYTALAHQTISRHFRTLRDAINDQIQAARRSLGDQDDSSDRVLPRLRNVEKQLRQQRTLHPLGVMRHSWRPQRGLPESSVSILRAWLFEHFLNPYPKDSEKIMLAKQTGLTRSQIANWFINARVRLWKPMVEDMYKEEFRDQEVNDNSNPEFVNEMEVNVGQRHNDLADPYSFDEPQLLPDFLVQ